MTRHIRHNRGLTLIDVLIAVFCIVLILAVVLPVTGQVRKSTDVVVSMSNLASLGVAHALYAADWKGRQFTNIPDDISTYGYDFDDAFDMYEYVHGEPVPPLLLGWGCDEDDQCGLWAYWMDHPGNRGLTLPINFTEPLHLISFGSFRIPNAKPFHDYVAGRFYEPTFYAPNDPVPYGLVEQAFDEPDEFVPWLVDDGPLYWSSYCFSPAAMLHPNVMRSEPEGGWQNPWTIMEGFQSPAFSQALYPELKTHIIEHHWNQDAPPDPCNPNFCNGTYDGCEPYYFNHAYASAPATLFYDMSVRLLPNSEVLTADQWLMNQTGYGLWSRDTPFGEDGYFSDFGYDFTQLSHHILTTDGIRGRDTVSFTAPHSARAHQ